MNRTTFRLITWIAAAGVASLGLIYLLNGLTRGSGSALVHVVGSTENIKSFTSVENQTAIVTYAAIDSPAAASLARAGIWLPALVLAVALSLLGLQVPRTQGRLALADLFRPTRIQWWLAGTVALMALAPGFGVAVAGSAVLSAAGWPEGFTPLSTDVGWYWLVFAAAILIGRQAWVERHSRDLAGASAR